jgi:two-component system chemotaxis response regulator CheB
MQGHDIVVIGASAGGVETLTRLVSGLPADLNASLFIVLHVAAHTPSILPKLLNRHSVLLAMHPTDRQEIQKGEIYVAPSDLHLVIKPGMVHVICGPKENGHRPAVDPMFRSAAFAYGGRVIGVVLSGTLDDGTAGLAAIKKQGGITVVQSPDEALYSGMPRSAIENVDVDHVVTLDELPALLVRLVNEEVPHNPNPSHNSTDVETEIVDMNPDTYHGDDRPGTPSSFACPDCGGTLWELSDNELIRFRCRTGHAFSIDSLLARQSDSLEEALWVAVRALEERASLSRCLSERMLKRGNTRGADRMEEQARDSERRAELIRQILVSDDDRTIPGEAGPEPGQG